jgi:hypothetical protein
VKTIRLLAILVCLFATACSPVKDQAVSASSPTAELAPETPASVPTPSPLPTATAWRPSLPAAISPLPTAAVNPSLPVDEQIAQLLQGYQCALAEELAHGETVIVKNDDGTQQKMLAGKSQEKIDALWAETVAKIDALKARPAEARQPIIDMLAAHFGETVQYVETTGLLFYSQSARMEVYQSSKMEYTVDIASGQIIEIQPLPVGSPPYHTTPRLTPVELEQRARQFILSTGANVNLSFLTPAFGNKTDTFFFRWEDRGRRQPDGGARFVQVGYSAAGDFLNYYNTLPLP